MKNLLIHVSPNKNFHDEEHRMSVKIQIDNSLALGWKRDDIILATNFDYEYNGVKSILIDDDSYCDYWWPATKINSIVNLFKKGIIEKGLYWYHDFDCFELNKIIESEVREEMGECNLGASNYCQRIRLCSASMFFDEKAEDMFDWMKADGYNRKKEEEMVLMKMAYDAENPLSKRFKMVNTTYAFHKFNIVKTYKTTIKPIRAAHFHLTPDKYDFYVRGNNKLNKVLIPERLITIFEKHGFKE